MDPNAALDELRSWVDGDLSGRPAQERADRMAELVDGLDQWLSKGGFLPDAWSNGGPRL